MYIQNIRERENWARRSNRIIKKHIPRSSFVHVNITAMFGWNEYINVWKCLVLTGTQAKSLCQPNESQQKKNSARLCRMSYNRKGDKEYGLKVADDCKIPTHIYTTFKQQYFRTFKTNISNMSLLLCSTNRINKYRRRMFVRA